MTTRSPASAPDLTPDRRLNRRVGGRIWRLSWPIVLSNVTVPLVGAVDTAVAGHMAEAAFIGAVALGGLVFDYIYWAFGFLRMGTTGLVAQARGARDRQEMSAVLARALLIGLTVGGLILVLAAPLTDLALSLIGGSRAVEDGARDYVLARFWGAPAALGNIAILGWLFGMQAMRWALVQQFTVNILNAALSPWFAFSLGFGLEGIGAAAAVAQWSGLAVGTIAVWRLSRRARLGWPGWPSVRAPEAFKAMMRINRDIFLRTLMLLSATALFMDRSARLGDDVLAANSVLKIFQTIAAYGLDGFAHAAEALVGEALGRRSARRLSAAVTISNWFALALAAGIGLAYYLTAPWMIALMTDLDTVRAAADPYIIWVALLPVVSVWSYQLDGIFIGATRTGEMRDAMVMSLVAFVALAFTLPALWGNHGLWLAYFIFMIIRAATLMAYYPRIRRAAGASSRNER